MKLYIKYRSPEKVLISVVYKVKKKINNVPGTQQRIWVEFTEKKVQKTSKYDKMLKCTSSQRNTN